ACGIYISNERTNCLSLEACFGLNYEELKKVSFAPGEGIIGEMLNATKPLSIKNGLADPSLAFIVPYLDHKHESFLLLPLRQGNNPIGVMILQRETGLPFKKTDILSLLVTTSQLSNVMTNVKMLMMLETSPIENNNKKAYIKPDSKFLKGKSASIGFAFGHSKSFEKERILSFFYNKKYTKTYSLEDFRTALNSTVKQLEKLQNKVKSKLADMASLIFTAHLLILKDKAFIDEIELLINRGINAPNAILDIGKIYLSMFALNENLIMREKQQDFEDLLTRIIHNLVYNKGPYDKFYKSIIITKELYPSDILKMSAKEVSGIVLLTGGITSHVAILAKSLQIPMVIVNKDDISNIPDDTPILVDADTGNVYINPSADIIKKFEKHKTITQIINDNQEFFEMPNRTLDGIKINLFSNINLVSDVHLAIKINSDGIGVYRTEFPFLIRSNFPTEEEQYFVYCKVVEGMQGKPITFRTLDIGGDKLLSYFDFKEKNPFLGLRSTRFTMEYKEIFEHQIRAILRAGVNSDLRIMFPMISSIEEFISAKEILNSCIKDLGIDGIAHNKDPQIGIMVEVPAIIDIIDDIAKEVDFFSIGTNDLIQFLIAVDRTNEKVAKFYNPLHPSVLRSLKKIVDSAIKNQIDVSICGDMAHEEKYLPFLLGIGLRSLSINPIYFPKIKKAILEIDCKKAEELANNLLLKSRLIDIEELINII
ncbi:MAG: phosphoenolpyruvate--protein phosphotransferase, partial [Candidatus Omnitrophica bacterium]|nr:phosphoenolpyruvate--protein phosphotransferase [Candidatus Omnitrophota bacterium]